MKKQFLRHNNTAVENTVIAEQLNELSKGELTLENPDEVLTSTNQLLKTLGLQNNNNNNSKSNNNNRGRQNNRKKQQSKKKYKN